MMTKDRIIKNTLALFAGTAVGYVFSFLLMVCIARTLGDVGVGQYSFLFAFGYLITILCNPGMEYLITKDVPANKDITTRYGTNLLSMKAILAVVSVVVSFLLLASIRDDVLIIKSFMIVAVIYGIGTVGSVFGTILNANERMDLTALIDVIERATALFAGVVLLYVTRSLLYLVLALLISNLVRQFLYFFFARRYFIPRFGFDFGLWKRLFVRSVPFALSISFLYIYHRIDTVMLSLMIGDQVTGWYNAAYRLIDVIHYIPYLLVLAILPPMAQYSRENTEVLTDIFTRSFRYLAMLALPIGVGMFLLAPRLILFVFGEGFENATPALRILIWAEVFVFLNYLGGHLLNMIDRQKHYTVIIGVTVLFNIILNLLLIPSYHHIGAAAATLICELAIFALVYSCIGRYFLRFNPLLLVWRPALAAVIMGALVETIQFLPVWCIVITGCVWYAIVLFILKGFNKQDKEALRSVLGILGRKTFDKNNS
ncbi:MAG TPA: flippase [Syntrophales bacterium]|nr:flippase [Syntrophales bacterium]HPQ43695.1 flippase [Syntrophales bacterium]